MSAGGVDGWRDQARNLAEERKLQEAAAERQQAKQRTPKAEKKPAASMDRSRVRLCARAFAGALPEDARTTEGLALWLVTDGAEHVLELAEALVAARSR